MYERVYLTLNGLPSTFFILNIEGGNSTAVRTTETRDKQGTDRVMDLFIIKLLTLIILTYTNLFTQ